MPDDLIEDMGQEAPPKPVGSGRRRAPKPKKGKDDSEPMFTDDAGSDAKTLVGARLDSEPMKRLHNRLMSRYHQELARHETNRREQAQDEDFYDGKQWEEEDAQVLRDRGQIPLVYNVLAVSFDWLAGTERRMRTDSKVLPRRKDAGKAAERKTQLLKYLSDVNRSQFGRSRAFQDAAKVGVGWLEDGVQDDSEGEPVYSRYESWRNMIWDSSATDLALDDARDIYRTKWVDEDIAMAMFPKRKGAIKVAVGMGGPVSLDLDVDGDSAMDAQEMAEDHIGAGYDALDPTHQRRRVRLIEAWYRVPMDVMRVRGGQFSGEIYNDDTHPGVNAELESGQAELVKRTIMRMHVAIMTTEQLLYVGESPYRHNGFPFTPIWGKRRGRDNMPYGYIRNQKDIQIDINKRAAKALHILNTNKVVMEKGAVKDVDALIEEIARPDAIIEIEGQKRFELNVERGMDQAHLDMMSRSIQMIQSTGGITDENMGRKSNATSGRAIQARQDQGSLATALYFDNLRFATQVQGEKQLSLIEQFFTEPKSFRITNSRGTATYIDVNDGMPENDIARTKADFIISEDAWNATRKQAEVESLMEMLGQLAPVAPQVAMVMLDLIVDGMDIANREELVKRIRSITGMRDPDAEDLTPEEIQAQQNKQAESQMQQRGAMAEIAAKEADANYKTAQAQKLVADMQQVIANMASTNVDTQRKGFETAAAMMALPIAAPVADRVLNEAGFVSATENAENERATGMLQGEQMQRQQQEQAAQAQQQGLQQLAQEEAQRVQLERDRVKSESNPVQRQAMQDEDRQAAQMQKLQALGIRPEQMQQQPAPQEA